MQKIEYLEELLPNFEQFLEDLSSVKLTSDLERRVKTYKQRIKSHIEQHSKQPGSVPPKVPGSHPSPLGKSTESNISFISKQRIIARETHSSSGGSIQAEDDNIYEENEVEDFYLEPSSVQSSPPPLPSTDRPALKSGTLGRTQPEEPNGQMYYDFAKDSTPVRVVDQHEEQLLYQDVDDGTSIPAVSVDNYDDDFSDSTDFEEVGEGDQVTTPTIQPKQKKGKFAIFQEQFVEDAQVDMIGELFYCNMYGTGTISMNKWVKRYCVARDMHLQCHNGPKKKVSLDIPLPGHTVTLAARTAGKKNVLIISHPSKGDQMFSCRSKEEAERWLEVLQDYATMGHEIVPNSGYIASVETNCGSKGKEKEKKNKKKKKKDKNALSSPELTVDDTGNLSGYVNLYGIHFGEPKWKKHWISIKESTFSCHLEPNGICIFSFNLKKTTIDLAEEKSSQDSTTLKIVSGEETYVLIEPLHVIDSGRLLKSLVAGMTAGAKPEEKQKQSGLVAKLMEAFEQSQSEPSFYEPCSRVTSPALSPVEDSSPPPFTNQKQKQGWSPGWSPRKREPSVVYFQARGPSLDEEVEREESLYTNRDILRSQRPELPDNVEELYLEVLADYCQSSREETTSRGDELPEEDYLDLTPSYNNATAPRTRLGSLKIPRMLTKKVKPATPVKPMNLRLHKNNRAVSSAVKSPDEEEPSKVPSSNENKTSSGKTSTFQRFFSKNSNNLAVKDDNKNKVSPKSSPKPSPKSSPKLKPKVEDEKTVKKAEPGKPDLKLAAKLSEERTVKEAKRKELNQKKKEIRLKKFSLKTDAERDAADEELRAIQKEWNEVNSSLIDLEKNIYMAKLGTTSSDDTSTNNSNSSATNDGLPGNNWTHKRGSVASRASEINRRMSLLEDATIGEDEKVSAGTVKNMKFKFQGN